MGWFKSMITGILKLIPAKKRKIVIQEPLSFQENVLKNKIWYRGEPAELEQFFKKTTDLGYDMARFWAAVPFRKVRKIHSGLVSIVVDRFKDIVTEDLDAISFGEEGAMQPIKERWDLIAKENNFINVLGEAVAGALSSGDGAFKISLDEVSQYPVIEFYEADVVDFHYRRGRLQEILFYTPYKDGEKEYRLEETYGKGYVRCRLLDETGKEVPLDTLEETAVYEDTGFDGDFMMATPLIIFSSNRWKGRGKALFDTKSDNLDALDEVISQWLDAIRKGRINRYIPEDMIPRNPIDGHLIEPNDFDNDYIAVGSMKKEDTGNKIEISQPQISYEAYVNSYSGFLDLAIQGIISPATLGIDLKKTDNAESQREKEKITLHTRNKIVDILTQVIPELVSAVMMTYDNMIGQTPGKYEASVKFGEYASPDFDSTVETVGKAKKYGVMSTEKAVDEMYGDTMTDEEKAEEVQRIKKEQGVAEVDEPGINTAAGGFRLNMEGGYADEGKSNEPSVPNEPEGVSGAVTGGKGTGTIRDLRN